MATKKKMLQAAAGVGGGGWTLDNVTGINMPSFYLGNETLNPQDVFLSTDGTKMYVVGGIAPIPILEYSLSTAGDITTASYVQSFDVSSQDGTPNGVFFKPDGTIMYVIGNVNDSIYQYSLSTAWDISTAVYGSSFSVASEETAPQGLFFKPDGTKLFIVGSAEDTIKAFTLSTPWQITTCFGAENLNLSALESGPTGVFFKSDGTKVYAIGSSSDNILEYALSTAWDISTSTYTTSFSVFKEEPNPSGLFFNDDGTKMYIIGTGLDAVQMYNLSTAWDISTAYFNYPSDYYLYVGDEDVSPNGLFFKPDGTKLFIIGSGGDAVDEFSLSTAWNVATGTYTQSFGVSSQDTNPKSVFFKEDGTEMYIVGSTSTAYQYSLSTAWDISTASYTNSFSVITEENDPNKLLFSTDGTKMYVTGNNSKAAWRYSLSTAWDISTASISSYGKYYVGGQAVAPAAVFFKPDGTQMYVCCSSTDSIYEYALSTAWDVSSASYVRTKNVNVEEGSPQGLYFSSSGNYMFIVGSSGDEVNKYVLSTPWNISTAADDSVFSISGQETISRGVFFKPDGTRMYVTGSVGDDVNEYTIAVAWNLGNVTYNDVFSVASQTSGPNDLSFSDDGTKMYIVGNGNIYQYSLSTAWELSTTSYVSSKELPASLSPSGLYFKTDGTRLYIANPTNQTIDSYSLSTAWDISTIYFDEPANSYLYLDDKEQNPTGLFFKPDGKKLFVVGNVSDSAYEYDLNTAWDISTANYVQDYSIINVEPTCTDIFIKPDGASMYLLGTTRDAVFEYKLT